MYPSDSTCQTPRCEGNFFAKHGRKAEDAFFMRNGCEMKLKNNTKIIIIKKEKQLNLSNSHIRRGEGT